ncbi:penicillin-binding protein 1C, partial [Paracoccus sp. PXZ]
MRSRRFALSLMAAVLVLGIGAGARDRLDAWVDATVLPRLEVPVGVEVVARDGSLLRAFQVADGRWRLDAGPVDPLFLDML